MARGFTRAQRERHKIVQRDLLEASWAARDRSELEEARALIADLHEQLDRANAAAVRMAQTGDFWRSLQRKAPAPPRRQVVVSGVKFPGVAVANPVGD